MTKIKSNMDNLFLSQEELLKAMALGHYDHLKIFMSRKADNYTLPQDFLWIDKRNFGKVTVTDICFIENHIIMEIKECTTGIVKDIHVDIKVDPEFIMIRWDDIKKMVLNEGKTTTTDENTLLVF